MNKKLFVCLPLENESPESAIAKQNKAAKDLEAQTGDSYEIVEYIDASIFVLHPMKAIAKALDVMSDADVVVCLPGWEKSKVCRVLRLCADGYGIRTLVLDNAGGNQ